MLELFEQNISFSVYKFTKNIGYMQVKMRGISIGKKLICRLIIGTFY